MTTIKMAMKMKINGKGGDTMKRITIGGIRLMIASNTNKLS